MELMESIAFGTVSAVSVACVFVLKDQIRKLEGRVDALARLVPAVVSAGVSAAPQGERVHGGINPPGGPAYMPKKRGDPDPLDTTTEHDLAAARYNWRIVDAWFFRHGPTHYKDNAEASLKALRHLLGDKPATGKVGMENGVVARADKILSGSPEGCLSAVSPCSHQRKDPTTLCETCIKAGDYKTHDRAAETAADLRELRDLWREVSPHVFATFAERGHLLLKLNRIKQLMDKGR